MEISMENLKKTMESIRIAGLLADWNPECPEYKGVITTQPRRFEFFQSKELHVLATQTTDTTILLFESRDCFNT
jgi:hypothetical protein